MNYYPFHLGDYAAHTAHLEPMEDLAYRRMLDLYYRTEKPLPDDWRDIARLIRMRDHGDAIEAVLSEFFMLSDDGWRHFRCDSEITKMQDKQAKAKASAKASVNARSTNAQRTLNERSTSSTDERSTDVELPTPTPTPTPTPNKDKKTARKRAAPSVLVSVDNLVSEGVDPQHAADWLTARSKKSLPLTPTAWAGTKLEAGKAGMTVADAIKAAATNGWAGFKASWLVQVDQPRGSIQPVTTPCTDRRGDDFLTQQAERAKEATKPPAALKALLGGRAQA